MVGVQKVSSVLSILACKGAAFTIDGSISDHCFLRREKKQKPVEEQYSFVKQITNTATKQETQTQRS